MVFGNEFAELYEVKRAFKFEQTNTFPYRKRTFFYVSTRQIAVSYKVRVVIEILDCYYLLLERLSVWNEH